MSEPHHQVILVMWTATMKVIRLTGRVFKAQLLQLKTPEDPLLTTNTKKNFKGSTPEIGATISLPTERVNNDNGFDYFKDTSEN